MTSPVAGGSLSTSRQQLEMLIRRALRDGALSQRNLAEAIRQVSDQMVHPSAASLFHALRRLERAGLVANGTARAGDQQFRLTAAGRRELTRDRTIWEQFVRLAAKIL